MGDVNLIKSNSKGIEKGIKKLFDTAMYFVSPWIDSKHKRKMDDASAEGIIKLAEANAQEAKILGNAKIEQDIEKARADNQILSEKDDANYKLLERAQQRFLYEQIDNQHNIDNIVNKSIKYLPEEVSDEPVNKDWKKRFFDRAKDISDEEVQDKWAKILAGEVEKPGSYDFRTLDILYNLTKEEADIFNKLAKLSINKSIVAWDKDFFINELGIKFEDQIMMKEIGLLSPTSNLYHLYNPLPHIHLVLDDKIIIIICKDKTTVTISELILTCAGHQLSNLIQKEYPDNYIKHIANIFKKATAIDSIRIYDFVKIVDDIIEYDEDKYKEI